jgi:small subunit ribosomal protein S20
MPQHKSAEKRVRTNDRDRVRNVATRSRLRKVVTAQREGTDAAEIGKNLPGVISEIARAKKKGIIPGRRADRLKSRMAKHARRVASTGK